MTSEQSNGHQTNGSNGAQIRASIGNRENAYNAMSQYIPKGASGIGVHDFVPETGYREYWYPGVEAADIKRKPVALRLLGEQIVFFRDTKNEVVALSDICPHRGAFLSGGIGKAPMNDEFKGFIVCPYHGYTFDGEGQCVAALTDGPESKLAPKLRNRKYPTRTLHGVVWIWMGVTEPVPSKRTCHRSSSKMTWRPLPIPGSGHELVLDHGRTPGIPQLEDSPRRPPPGFQRADIQPGWGFLGRR